jgi:hypothetical protein
MRIKSDLLENTEPQSDETVDGDHGNFSLKRPGNLSFLRRELSDIDRIGKVTNMGLRPMP